MSEISYVSFKQMKDLLHLEKSRHRLSS